jgi:hypothetical protein
MSSRDHLFDEDHPELNNKGTAAVSNIRFKPGAGVCSCGAPTSRWFMHANGKTVVCGACHQDKGEAYAEPNF